MWMKKKNNKKRFNANIIITERNRAEKQKAEAEN